MSSKRVIGLALLVLGIILLIFGFNATHKMPDEIMGSVTGRYTDKTMLYIISGAVLTVVGGALALLRGRR